MYSKCGQVFLERRVFDEMSQRNIVSWSAMISSYDQCGGSMGWLSTCSLRCHSCPMSTSLPRLCKPHGTEAGATDSCSALKSGYAFVSFVSLITMYMKCGHCSDALSVRANSLRQNFVSYNALISGFVENHEPRKGLECSSSCSKGLFLISNLVEEVEKAFRLIKDKDVIPNTLISAFSHCDNQAKYLRFFEEMMKMKERSIRPDDFTFTIILAACAWHASINMTSKFMVIYLEQDYVGRQMEF
ncbi:Pentatricopeptide repeat-containing protein, chloroplastic, partial [Mucuna pruriens]